MAGGKDDTGFRTLSCEYFLMEVALLFFSSESGIKPLHNKKNKIHFLNDSTV